MAWGEALTHDDRREGSEVRRLRWWCWSQTRRLVTVVLCGASVALVAAPASSAASSQSGGTRGSTPAVVTVSIHGEGIVTAGGHATPCNQTCVMPLPASRALTLMATPAQGYSFPGWQHGCSGDAPICAIPPGANAQVSVSFVRSSTLELTVSGPGEVSSSPDGIDCGQSGSSCVSTLQGSSTITLSPVPADGAGFLGWGGPCTQYGTASCLLNGGADAGVTAAFAATSPASSQPQPVTVEHPDLTVTSAPDLLGPCTQNPCSTTAPSGTQMSITAGGSFALDALQPLPQVRWSGACRGVWPVCSLGIEGPTAVTVAPLFAEPTATATFHSSYELPISTFGHGTVVPGAHSACRYPARGCSRGQRIQLIARPGRGYRLYRWYTVGFSCRTNPVCSGRAGPSEDVTAAFAAVRRRR
jgi:hypothetical protein